MERELVLNPIGICDFLIKEIPKKESYVGENIIDPKSRVMISGEAKIGKTVFVMNLAVSLAIGKDFLGFNIMNHHKVLYIQQEISEANLQKRFKLLCEDIDLDNGLLQLVTVRGLNLSKKEHVEKLRILISETRPEIVISDPLYKFHNSDENSSSEMKPLLDVFDSLIEDYAITIILVHHHRKAGKMGAGGSFGAQQVRGTSTFRDWTDTNITLNYGKRSSKDTVQVHFELRNGEEPNPLLISRNKNLWFQVIGRAGKEKYGITDIIPIMATLGQDWVLQKDVLVAVSEKLKISETTVRNILKAGKDTGVLEKNDKGRPVRWKQKKCT